MKLELLDHFGVLDEAAMELEDESLGEKEVSIGTVSLCSLVLCFTCELMKIQDYSFGPKIYINTTELRNG